ncbi:MAG: ABC transporter permease [Bacteroidota bacterium]
MNSLFIENIKEALISIRSHLLRSILTVLIIAIGIMALVGILTALDSVKGWINNDFTQMGANSFSIENRGMHVHMGKKSKRPKHYPTITYSEAMDFKQKFDFPSVISISTNASQIATLKYGSNKTNPNISVIGSDDNYTTTSGYDVFKGRNFTSNEITYGSHVVIIGSDVSSQLFKNNENPIGKIIAVGSGKYQVIGVLKEKGSSMGFSGDRSCVLPVNNVRQYFASPNQSYKIEVQASNTRKLDEAIGEATSLFRNLRKLKVSDEENFEILKSDNLAQMLIENLRYVTVAATLIGLITLLGAAVGLMNIMLVSVTERTREIGVRKAIGATKKVIKNQFIAETIVICQFGGILGIILGILIGNITSLVMNTPFVIPWIWMIAGIIICFIVGIISGIFPAIKASKLDPIESLRYE